MSFKLAIAAALGSFIAVGAAHANDAARFELANTSEQRIDTIQVSPVRSDNWGPDLLGRNGVLQSGDSVIVTPGAPGCQFDVRVIYRDGSKESFRNINLCRTDKISFAHSRDYVQN